MTGDLPYIAGKKTNYDRLHIISEHLHGIGKVAPQGAAPITVTAGGGAWTLGAASATILTTTAISDLHHAVISDVSANEDYEMIFYADGVEIGAIGFSRSNNFVNSITVPLMTPQIKEGAVITAKLMDGTGGATANVKVQYHEY